MEVKVIRSIVTGELVVYIPDYAVVPGSVLKYTYRLPQGLFLKLIQPFEVDMPAMIPHQAVDFSGDSTLVESDLIVYEGQDVKEILGII